MGDGWYGMAWHGNSVVGSDGKLVAWNQIPFSYDTMFLQA